MAILRWVGSILGAMIVVTIVVAVVLAVLSLGALISLIGVGVVIIGVTAAAIHDAMGQPKKPQRDVRKPPPPSRNL